MRFRIYGNRALRELANCRGLRGFSADRRGTTAVEFGFVIFPFLAMLFGIIGVGLFYFTVFTMENAVENASRLILTGQMQQFVNSGSSSAPNYNYSANSTATSAGCTSADPLATCFLRLVCSEFPFSDCMTKMVINVTSYTNFSTVSTPSCLSGGNAVTTGTYTPGTASQVVLVSACYEWDMAISLPQSLGLPGVGSISIALGNMNNGGRMLQASSVFMTEPYN